MGKKLSSRELYECGFVNKVFPASSRGDEPFGETVVKYLGEQFNGLDLEAVSFVFSLFFEQPSLVCVTTDLSLPYNSFL